MHKQNSIESQNKTTTKLHGRGASQISTQVVDTIHTPLHSSEVRMLTRGHGLTYLGKLE